MKHYLELASLSAKVRRKQNRMSIFCIVLAVFLVTAIFGMADMYIRSQLLPAGPQSRRHQASSDRYCPGPSSRRRKQEKPVSHDRLLFPKHHPLSFLFRGCGFHESFSDSATPMDSGHFHYQPGTALTVYSPDNLLQTGDTLALSCEGDTKTLQIAGTLSSCPFTASTGASIVICSEDTFRQLTGENGYTIVDLQLASDASDADVNAIHQLVGTQYTFSDERISNASAQGAWYCFRLFVCGFLVLIALITIFNVINSISMSAAARTRQYGICRAIGLSTRQLLRMLAAEAAAYAAAGGLLGAMLGLFFHHLLFSSLITIHWGDSWTAPWAELGTIVLIMLLSVALAVYGPWRRLRDMSIVDTIRTE